MFVAAGPVSDLVVPFTRALDANLRLTASLDKLTDDNGLVIIIGIEFLFKGVGADFKLVSNFDFKDVEFSFIFSNT